MLDPRHLRVLRAVAQQGSLSAAARSLGLTQPAVSQQMQRLEEQLGTPLVVRAGRSVRLTLAGEALARRADAVLAALEAAEEEVAAIAGLRAGRVRVVSFPSGSAALVPRAIALMRAEHPGVDITLVEAEPPIALGLVRAGDADIALVYAYPGGGLLDDVDVVRRELLHDPLRLVLPRDDARAADESVDLAAFADEPWIAGSRSQAALRHVCARAGFEPRIAFATDDNVAVLGLVAAGLGVALATELVLSTASNRGVVSRPLTIPVQRSVATITVPDAERVPAVRAFADALVAAAHGIATTTAIDPAAAPA